MTAAFPPPSPIASSPHRWWALHVSGELDIATAPDFDARLGRALAVHHGDGFVLDLSDVPFMDCAGLSPVVRVHNRLGRRLCLRGVQPRVRRLLDLARVSDTLRILPGAEPWPVEADPRQCHVVLDDPFDHRSAQPFARLGHVSGRERLSPPTPRSTV